LIIETLPECLEFLFLAPVQLLRGLVIPMTLRIALRDKRTHCQCRT
jgi:hypothetical protein